MDGLILIDKPLGWTSFDAVNKIRRAAGIKRVGHAGTLDPLATGLLLVCIGPACKRIERFVKLPKTYAAEVRLGAVSSTDDGEGDKKAVSDRQPSAGEVTEVLESLTGEQQQLPPAYSAIKVNGVRAYKLARKGRTVKLEPRTVIINRLQMDSYAYPRLNLTADVSSGTYIRSLARDIGERLRTGAYLSGLRRTRVGDFDVSTAVSPETITAEQIADHLMTLDQEAQI